MPEGLEGTTVLAHVQVLKPELKGKYGQMSLGKYVRQQGYSQAFVNNYLLPMCAAVWSVPNAQVRRMPSHSAPLPAWASM